MFWIDALCINQMDNGENGHQVVHKGPIYSGAKRVIVWLGVSRGERSGDTLRELKTIDAPKNVQRKRSSDRVGATTKCVCMTTVLGAAKFFGTSWYESLVNGENCLHAQTADHSPQGFTASEPFSSLCLGNASSSMPECTKSQKPQ